MKFDTVKDAAREWVSQFNAIPQSVVEKLLKFDVDELVEVTPPSKYDRVYIYDDEHDDEHGEIVDRCEADNDMFVVELDRTKERIIVSKEDFEVDHDSFLPMWGTMWAFGEEIDNDWLDNEFIGNGLQLMADCGFRIYEQEDYRYIFGIDGAGYDFYESHWIPLYKARGLHWHKEE